MRVAHGLTPDVLADDHHKRDPLPPLAVLAQWEDLYRQWAGHTPGRTTATLHRAITYLSDQLSHIAQDGDGPDYLAFTRQTRDIRVRLERALHNEQDPERGVECFECGDTLERRWRDPARCTHDTPARLELRRGARLGYPQALTTATSATPTSPAVPATRAASRTPRPASRGSAPAAGRTTTPASTPPPSAVTSSRAAPTATGGPTSGWPPRP
ncbi:hypothetical protein ASG88_11200 [Nocardioides sp. Soil777]|uniref:hypothetical protein n=1 Tax=Nocardioides sp. Soil777 TaxID=1736409 RepID=UPI0007029D94|nr:hypothetical protein [Nocardioides sp. Soil777]KRF00958.1 hypothetical protein ASG88_11200 [Nocardioides sp. Soil777]